MTWGIWQIFTRAYESLKIGILMRPFNSKLKKYELKIHRGVICHENEEWHKILRGIDLSFQSWHEEIWQILTWVLESLKKSHFNGLLLIKAYIFCAKKVQRIYLSWNWIRIQNLERNRLFVSKLAYWQILTWALESLKNLHFNGLLLSKVCFVSAKKVQRSYLAWNWRVIQNLKRNRLVVSKLA